MMRDTALHSMIKRADSAWWREGFTAEWWRGLPLDQREMFLSTLSDEELEDFFTDWRVWARAKQLPPDGDWKTWLLCCGRGFGKTRTSVEYILEEVEKGHVKRVAIVGQGLDDIRTVMIEGEALCLETEIPTPSGWARFGDLKVGDELFSREGSVTRVAGVTPVWTDRPCYALTADGAAPIIADANHQWVTSSRSDRRPDRLVKREAVRRTEEIAAQVAWRRADLFEFEIPMADGLRLPDAELPVPPYTLGVWLGDGDTRGQGVITCHPDDISTVDGVRADGFEVNGRVGVYAWGVKKLKVKLRAAGLLGDKRVPEAYLRASWRQRHDLLCGLMDTDGYVSTRGQCAFDNTNRALVEAVRELLLTLGYKPGAIMHKASAVGRTMPHGGLNVTAMPIFRVTFTVSAGLPPPFRMPRKVERCRVSKRSSGRLVRSVEKVDSVPVRCIQVEHPSGTFLAGRDFVVTHNSGFLACAKPGNKPKWYPSVGGGRLEWPNGAVAFVYSAEDTEALRGPQFHLAWFDEPMAVPAAKREEAFSNLKFCLRLKVPGSRPRLIISTTPKKHSWMRQMLIDAGNPKKKISLTKGSTYENEDNLAEDYIEMVKEDFEGTRLGRQEIHGELLGDDENALWGSELLERQRKPCPETDDGSWPSQLLVAFARTCDKVVVGVDPNAKAGTKKGAAKSAHAAGIIVVARKGKDRFVLADRSTRGGPSAWGKAAVLAAMEFETAEIVAEVNQGGDMVRMVIQQAADDLDYTVKVVKVHATRGKTRRAEPVASQYERGRVFHMGLHGSPKDPGPFLALEDQMTSLHEGYDPTGEDFDRADALVWGLTRLKVGRASSTASASGSAGIMTFSDFGR